MIDAEKHKRYTCVDNQLILENLKILAESGAAIRVRIPLIGGVNDDDASIEAAAAFVAALHGEKKPVDLLPFHDVAKGKDMKLGQERDLSGLSEPTPDDLERVISVFARHGLAASIGG
jgi:pyruvate formate lyase activating enzyme